MVSIGDGAFNGCSKLANVYYGGTKSDREKITIGEKNTKLINAKWQYSFKPYEGLTTLTLHADLEMICDGAFQETAAEVIIIPATVAFVAEDAFDDCPNLKYIVNRSTVTITAPTGVTVIKE